MHNVRMFTHFSLNSLELSPDNVTSEEDFLADCKIPPECCPPVSMSQKVNALTLVVLTLLAISFERPS